MACKMGSAGREVNSLDTAVSTCRFRSKNHWTEVRRKIPGPLHRSVPWERSKIHGFLQSRS
jgi:hypothetical protein